MDRARDWVHRFVHRRARRGRVVHALGANKRIRGIRDLPDRFGNRLDHSIDAGRDLIF